MSSIFDSGDANIYFAFDDEKRLSDFLCRISRLKFVKSEKFHWNSLNYLLVNVFKIFWSEFNSYFHCKLIKFNSLCNFRSIGLSCSVFSVHIKKYTIKMYTVQSDPEIAKLLGFVQFLFCSWFLQIFSCFEVDFKLRISANRFPTCSCVR